MSIHKIHCELKRATRIYHEVNYYGQNLKLLDITLENQSISITLCGQCGNYMALWAMNTLSSHSTCKCKFKLK